ncbi:MAG: arginine deiminase, partial [Bacteroidales bacterium]|nr:arginine deiminase [Bacteroidales bacterium]
MKNIQDNTKTTVNVSSEYGRLRAVLLHRPGVEIERMTPLTAHDALYSDILSRPIVDKEYAAFSGVFEKWCKVYYVEDLLTTLMDDDDLRDRMVRRSCELEHCPEMYNELVSFDNRRLAKALIEGVEYHTSADEATGHRFALRPLYNLFFTRDASSSLYNRVLINTMSFDVRQRETLIYRAIFEDYFRAETICAADSDPQARTEGGDVHVAGDDLLCIGEGIRTNADGIRYLVETFRDRPRFNIIVQQLPHTPESF